MKKYIIALIFLISFHFLFSLRTNNFFSTDDFFVLAYLKDHTIFETAKNFLIYGDLFGFRKLIGYVLFGIIFKVFGANHFAFDIVLYIIQATNLILLFLIAQKITSDNFKSFFVSLIFNKYYFSYYSNIHEVLVAMFSFLTIFLILHFPKKIYLYLLTFILALFSRETAITLPLVVLFLKNRTKISKSSLYLMFTISAMFFAYVFYFFVNGRVSQINPSYTVSLNLKEIISGILFFVDLNVLIPILILPFLTKSKNAIYLFIIFLITILPASLLVNRKEIYYIYLPFGYLMLYLSLILPKFNLKTSIVYVFIFFVFGGRQILPKIAWKEFPNWQKESIKKVIMYNDTNDLERDARLMIETNTTDLFRGKI